MKIAMRCRGTGIVTTYGGVWKPSSGTGLMVMEKVPGGTTLREAVIESVAPVSEHKVCTLLAQVAQACESLRTVYNVIHGDIKPENILVCGERAYLCDFGLARDTRGELVSATRVTETSAALEGGTPEYLAPEKWSNGKKRFSDRSDVYSFGLVIIDCFSRGNLIHDGQARRREALKNIDTCVPEPIRGMVLRSVSENPRERPPFAEIRKNLEMFSRSETVLPHLPPAPQRRQYFTQLRSKFNKRHAPSLWKAAWFQAPASMVDLGDALKTGESAQADPSEAVRLYRMAIERGSVVGMQRLGYCLQEGIGVSKDVAAAVELYRRAADQGGADAQNNLGVCLRDGLGVPKDEAAAVEWFERAADQGHAAAQTNLGYCLRNGTGVTEDDAAAVKWFRRAAYQGHAGAQYEVGYCLQNGIGVPKDWTAAVAWYRRAADQGHFASLASLILLARPRNRD